MTNMTNPAEEARKNLDELRFKISTLQDDASLKSTIDEFTDLTSKVENLDNRISSLRQRKYAFDGMLEKNAEDLLNRWKLNTSRVDSQIRMQSAPFRLLHRYRSSLVKRRPLKTISAACEAPSKKCTATWSKRSTHSIPS